MRAEGSVAATQASDSRPTRHLGLFGAAKGGSASCKRASAATELDAPKLGPGTIFLQLATPGCVTGSLSMADCRRTVGWAPRTACGSPISLLLRCLPTTSSPSRRSLTSRARLPDLA